MRLFYIKHNKLNGLIISSFFIVLTVIFFYSVMRIFSSSKTILTSSSIIKNYKSISVDADGNGKNDIVDISIDSQNKEYKIEITNDSGKKYILSLDSKSLSVGPYVPWWPLKISIADINMDKIPEIIVQTYKSASTPSLNIFRWNGSEYRSVLSGDYDGIIIADIDNDNIPEVIAEENIAGYGKVHTCYGWSLRAYRKVNTYLDTSFGGYDKIHEVIKFVSAPFDDKIPAGDILKKYFTDGWMKESKNAEYLRNFSKDIIGMQLQDYLGEEIQEDNNRIKCYRWKLRYIAFRKFGTELKLESYTAQIETEMVKNSPKQYKIRSMVFIADQ